MVSAARGLRPAVFLDRDGVIVVPEFRDRRSFAPRRLADFRVYPDAAVSLQRLKSAGFLLAVVTNQPDVGSGLIPRSEVEAMHEMLRRELPVDVVKACFHIEAERCECRKPKPGMILETANELGIDLARSYMVGDRKGDVEAGRAAGCITVFIDLDYSEPRPAADHVVRSIAQAAEVIIQARAPSLSSPPLAERGRGH
jgi:D-glycero-D-manno-heptose 1,7-bisphosphate phosphatase